MVDRDQEQAKWEQFYTSFPEHEEFAASNRFYEQLVETITKLLPAGARILEAGCGAGGQSLALAKRGEYQVTLMDFSKAALAVARQNFEKEGLNAIFLLEDIFHAGKPEYDLVFNSGVLEHYSFPEQVEMVRAMASRCKRYVMVLVPNQRCYWYWPARIQSKLASGWDFGDEIPLLDLSGIFHEAGIEFIGQVYLGSDWAADFIQHISGMDQALKELLLQFHETTLVPAEIKNYLVAALGSVQPVSDIPVGWQLQPVTLSVDQATLSAYSAENKLFEAHITQLNKKLEQERMNINELGLENHRLALENYRLAQELDALNHVLSDERSKLEKANSTLDEIYKSRAWRLVQFLWRVRKAFS